MKKENEIYKWKHRDPVKAKEKIEVLRFNTLGNLQYVNIANGKALRNVQMIRNAHIADGIDQRNFERISIDRAIECCRQYPITTAGNNCRMG